MSPPTAARRASVLPPALAHRAHDLAERIAGSRYAHLVYRGGRMARLVVSGFKTERITLRASSLTYLSLLSTVPVLAVFYAMFKAFGGVGKLQADVNAWIFQNIAVGSQEVVAEYVEKFATQAHTGAVGGIGFVALLLSSVSLLWNIEASFNAIWGVRQERRVLFRFLIYWCVLTMGPVLLAVSVAATAALQGAKLVQLIPGGKFLLGFAPLFITYAAFTLLYIVVPNARVGKRSAMIGAFVAGSLWELAKLGYAVYAARAFKANAFYGSLAAIPIFMLWIYLSWLIVLAGARLVYAIDASVEAETATPVLGAREREEWSARVARAVAEAFAAGKPPPTVAALAHQLGTLPTLVDEVACGLEAAGLIRETQDGGLLMGRPLEQITLREVRRAALAPPPGSLGSVVNTQDDGLAALLQRAELSAEEVLAEHSLAALVKKP